jgi:L-rhamnose-H+ transport protein
LLIQNIYSTRCGGAFFPMPPNPFLGVFFHWLGGLASGSFYVPYRGVRHWAWETYWLVGGVFSWLVCPTLLALALTNNLSGVLAAQSASTLGWTFLFGALWGLGGLTFGLTMRYLGMSLGMGVALGYCAAFGTLVPPIAKSLWPAIPVDDTLAQILASAAGRVTIAGVGVCLLGIAIAAYAGLTKERQLPEAEKRATIREFAFAKGIAVATFSGVMSACFAFALTAGNPIGVASLDAGTAAIWTGLPKLVVILLGGFTTNFLWCVSLNLRNRTGYQYLRATVPRGHPASAAAPSRPPAPMLRNYALSALAGITWYGQFFFYTMGETQMGRFGFASWTLHMASIIVFSTMWGWIFHEWKGSSRKAHALIAAGILVLILSTVVIGYGTWLKGATPVGH